MRGRCSKFTGPISRATFTSAPERIMQLVFVSVSWLRSVPTSLSSDQRTTMVALVVRVPRDSDTLVLCLRIRLADMASICWIAGQQTETVEAFFRRITDEESERRAHPMHILCLLLEERVQGYMAWHDDLRSRTITLETTTTMVDPSWATQVPPEMARDLQNLTNLLRRLHGVKTLLTHLDYLWSFADDLSSFWFETFAEVESLRVLLGHPKLAKRSEASLKEHMQFIAYRAKVCRSRTAEIIERASTQIPVVSGDSTGSRLSNIVPR
jgi:hypothetical protein